MIRCERSGDVSPRPAFSGILHQNLTRCRIEDALGQPFGSVGLFLEISDGHRCTSRAQVETNAFVSSILLASLTVREISHYAEAAIWRLRRDTVRPVKAESNAIVRILDR